MICPRIKKKIFLAETSTENHDSAFNENCQDIKTDKADKDDTFLPLRGKVILALGKPELGNQLF